MVVGFTNNYAISTYHVKTVQNVIVNNSTNINKTNNPFSPQIIEHKKKSMTYEIKFVSDLQQVGGFLQVLLFPPPIKLTAMI
jgi:hypothetical protein